MRPMSKSVILLSSNTKITSLVRRAVYAVGCELVTCDDIRELRDALSKGEPRAIVALSESARLNEFAYFYLSAGDLWVPLVLLCENSNKELFQEQMKLPFLRHLIPLTDPPPYIELIQTLSKIITGDFLGLQKYLPWGVVPTSFAIRRSEDKDRLIQELEDVAQRFKIHRRIIRVVAGVADEFIMNAVYNAPVTEDNIRPYASVMRTLPVELPQSDCARLQIACDGSFLYLAVRDRFGSLGSDKVTQYLNRCYRGGEDQIESKQGGAGMGLYFIVESLNKVMFNLVKGQATEVIGMVDVSGSYKEYAGRAKSYHLFGD